MTATTPRRAPARRSLWRFVLPGLAIAAVATSVATAQDKGTVDPKPLPPLANPDDPKTPAKELFGRRATAAPLQARSIGFYAKGCLAGAVAMPINGKTWQVMRLSRNRNWGHPDLVAFLEQLSQQAPKLGWRGLLVGDISQARGGPMLTGHASHQVGLDADIWLTPMPDARTDAAASARKCRRPWWSRRAARTSIRRSGRPAHAAIIKAAAEDPKVERIFVNAAIKKALCRSTDTDRNVAAQGAPDVGARLSLPHPHELPGGQRRLPRRRMRCRPATAAARSSTGGSATPSSSPDRAAEAEAGRSGSQAKTETARDDDGGPAAGVPSGAAGAVVHSTH